MPPEANAIKTVPGKTEELNPPINQSVQILNHDEVLQNNVKQGLAQTGIDHNTIPVKESRPNISPHVPSGETKSTGSPQVEVTGSFGEAKTPLSDLSKLSEAADYLDQVATGRSTVTGGADRFINQQDEREGKIVKFKNRPKTGPGPVKRFVRWIRDEDQEAA